MSPDYQTQKLLKIHDDRLKRSKIRSSDQQVDLVDILVDNSSRLPASGDIATTGYYTSE